MLSYKIDISVTDVGGVYTCENKEEANALAEEISNEVWRKLGGNCSTYVESVEEVKQ